MAWSDPHEVSASAAGERLVDYLKAHLIAVPVNEIGDAITGGAVLLDGRAGRTDERLRAGQRITVAPALEQRLASERRLNPPADLALAIAWEDEHLLVAVKPAGMHVHPIGRFRDATLLNALVHRAGARPGHPWGAWRPYPAHRLDRPVSGLVVVAKSAALRDAVGALVAEDRIERRYVAWVDGSPADGAGTVDAPVGRDPSFDYRRAVVPVERGGQRAVTHWKVRERRPGTALLELRLETGRTHQIRVHLASIGLPIRGDTLYSTPPAEGAPDPGRTAATRISLHAWRLDFTHPLTGAPISVEAAPPGDFD